MKIKSFINIKRIIITTTLFFIILAVLASSSPSAEDVNQKLQHIVSDLVENDDLVKNCVVSIINGEGSFAWSGAAGIANQDSQTPMIKYTPISIASITKLYTATVIMRLYEEQKISLDDPMSKYLPEKYIKGIHEYKGKDYSNEITIKQLLSHTSGIADYYSEKPEGGKSLFEIFLENPERHWTVDETIQRAQKDLKANFEPGTDTFYSDTNFQLLGKIIESVTQKPLHMAYNDFIFRPLGLTHTCLFGYSKNYSLKSVIPADVFYKELRINTIRSNGSYWADGGIVSTVEEMVFFLKALNQGRLIKKETLRLMHNWNKLHFPLQYGYGTMYFKLPRFIGRFANLPPLWGHSGSTGSFLYYSNDLDVYIAGTINQAESESKPFFALISKVLKAMNSKKN